MGIIIDSSDSIGLQNFLVMITNLKSVVQMTDVGPTRTRIGLIEYSSYARLITSFAHSQTQGVFKVKS